MRPPRGIETRVSPNRVAGIGAVVSATAATSGPLPTVIRLAMVAKMTTRPSKMRTPIPTTAILSARSGIAPQPLTGTFDPAETGERIDRALALRLPDLTRSRIKTLVEEGRVTIGGAPVKAADKVRAGQIFAIILPEPIDATPAPQPMALDVLFEDEHLIVIDKPPGLVVHPAPGNPDGTLVNALIAHCGPSLAGIGGERRPGIVHRLDKDTSGLMVVGKTLPALTALSRAIAAREVHREYLALAHGEVRPAAFSIDAPIARDPQSRVRMAVVASGKPARTDVKVVAVAAGISALRCTLHTGRTHQIRVHLAARGHPLVADAVYGGEPALGMTRQALHATRLAFVHPASGRPVSFDALPPADLACAWRNVAA